MEELNEKISSLEKRVNELEKKEKRRKIFNIIKIILKLIILGLIIFGIYKSYNYINDKYIKPIKSITNTSEKIDLDAFKNIFNGFSISE